ncbi:MAG: hypothetical protein JOY58_05940 [Solirubrobacterales bacterium]|nr:hypothetical protein [Solirubrobacterales bacterium]
MRSTRALPPLRLPVMRARARRQRLAWLIAHLRAPRIDRDLATGVAPWQSRSHAARSLQLTTARSRRALARSLERVLKDAEQPSPAFLSAAIVPCREQVYPARTLIGELAVRLRSRRPVAARGVAELRALLSDGAGPCYVSSDPQALTRALEAVSRWMDTRE